MELSRQMDKLAPEAAFSVLAKALALEAEGKKILHFEIGQPDFPTPKNIIEAGKKALDQGKTRYTEPLGIPELRDAIAKHISSTRQLEIVSNQIAVTPSPKTAIYLAMIATLNPGDEVMYPDPGFPAYGILTDFLGCIKKPIPLTEKNDFSFDMKFFRENFSERTKLVILNSPSNPTGSLIPEDDLKEISNIVLSSKNCFILSDEIYSQILYGTIKHKSIYSLPGMKDRVWLVDGFSKTYSMTGWRVGYLSFPREFEERINWLATNVYSCVAHFSQYAALEALTGPQDEVLRMVRELSMRREIMVNGLNSISGIKCRVPEGAFYAFPNITSFKKSSKEIADYLLKEAGVAVLDGTAFGTYGEGYIRLSYVNSVENIKEAIKKIGESLSLLN